MLIYEGKPVDVVMPCEVAGLEFRNPFVVSSGPVSKSIEQLVKAEETGWGGASIKLTFEPAPYVNREPRYGWFDGRDEGFLCFTAESRLKTEEGLRLLEEGRKRTKELVLLANITYVGEKGLDGWAEMASWFESAGAHAIELNMCCPNMSFNEDLAGKGEKSKHSTGASLGADPDSAAAVLRAVRKRVKIPVFVKTTPEGGRIAEVAEILYKEGADAVVSVANRLGITPVDIRRPGRGRYYLQDEPTMSCLSGGWIRPLALRDVYEIRKRVGPEPTVVGTGGISDYESVVHFAMAGADMFGICTEILVRGFNILPEIIRDLRRYMNEMGIKSLREVRDVLLTSIKAAPDLTLHPGHARIKDPYLVAPCVSACPNAVPAQGYVRATAKRDFRAAYELIAAADPLQRTCALICDRPCEEACTRGDKDEPIRIRAVKRFILDYADKQGWSPKLVKAPDKGLEVGVIGSGPAGLSAAYRLALAGYKVTVYEREAEPGGMLRWGIPRFRLPQSVLDRELSELKKLGVEIRTKTAATPAELLKNGCRAVVLAVGAWKPYRLEVEGEDAEGCLDALAFLREIAGGARPDLSGKRVCVIGGGFTAVDAARSAERLGAKEVFIAYRRTRDEMPAGREEVDETEAEGVKIMYLVAPRKVTVENGRVVGLRLVNHVLGEHDSSGRRRPVPVEEAAFELPCDLLINAVGQTAEVEGLSGELKTAGGVVVVEEETGATNLSGVWAAGDAAGARADVIGAVASGRRAASGLDHALAGDKATIEFPRRGGTSDKELQLLRHGEEPPKQAVEIKLPSGAERKKSWDAYEPLLTEEEAVAEARRCFGCGCGVGCGVCEEVCSSLAVNWNEEAGRGCVAVEAEKCHGCGMCAHLCPNGNIELVRADA